MPYTASRPQLFFRERGTGEPLLCIPGFAVSSAVFDSLSPLYERRFRYVTYDHVGSGRSAKYTTPVSMAQLAADAIRVLDELDIDAAHVLGSSLGGLVAQEIAIRFPHRVRGLLLVGTASAGPLATPAPIAGLARATAQIGVDSLRRRRLWMAAALFSDDFAKREPDGVGEVLASLTKHPAPPWALLGQLLAFSTYDRDRDLSRIRAPTLVLHGERDVLVSAANTHRLAAGIPNAEVEVVPGAGHACMYEQARPVFATICDWLDREQPVAHADKPSGLEEMTERLTRKAAVPIGIWRVQRNSVALAYRAFTNL